MKLNNNRGITGIDISLALGILILFVSIIASLSYNFVTSSRNVERKTRATYMAIEIIEDIKQIDYNSIINGEMQIADIEQLTGKTINKYDGYTATISSALYDQNDVLKIVTVRIEYTVGKTLENVEIKTAISKE